MAGKNTRLVLLVALLLAFAFVALADNVPIWTRAMNNLRDNNNLRETILNVNNVNSETFGKLYTRVVEGHVYASLLYIPDLLMPQTGQVHNVLFIATMANNVYAFDADNASNSEPFWKRNFGFPLPIQDHTIGAPSPHCTVYSDIHVEVGIVSTPVIDQSTYTMYLVATNKDSEDPYIINHRLHAIDIRTGESRPNSGVVIEGEYPGTGDASVNGVIPFTSLTQNQRLSLTLGDDGIIYFGFGSYCTKPIYHGWLFGYDKITLEQKLVWCTSPTGHPGQASIWQSGVGLIYEAPYLYAVSANGYFQAGTDWGNSVLKIDPRKVNSKGQLIDGVVDYFTPYDWEELWQLDLDLGCAGPIIIPGSRCIFGCGKQGYCYVVDKDNMGGNSPTTNNNLQYFKPNPNSSDDYPTLTMGIHGEVTWWQGGGKTRVYLWPCSYVLTAFPFIRNGDIGVLDLANVEKAPNPDPNLPVGFPGGMLFLSANGNDTNTGIIWAFHSSDGSANRHIVAGVLRAYDANDITRELWNSQQVPCRDQVGNIQKFSSAVVTNGKVFVPSMPSTPNRFAHVHCYGLLSPEQQAKKYINDSCCILNPCAIGTACCNGACYYVDQYYCSGGILCPKGQICNPDYPDPCLSCPDSCCFGQTCYDKNTHTCTGSTVCPNPLIGCADGCYSPDNYTCVTNYPVPNQYMPPAGSSDKIPFPSPVPIPTHSDSSGSKEASGNVEASASTNVQARESNHNPLPSPSTPTISTHTSAHAEKHSTGNIIEKDTSIYVISMIIGILAILAFLFTIITVLFVSL